jgi:NTP pyrophosphatase (non-canonical NTP hydrolase)
LNTSHQGPSAWITPCSANEQIPTVTAPVQELAWDNKGQGSQHDVPLEFGLLTAEIGEGFTAWRKRLPDFGEALADTRIYLAGLAQMTGIDLSTEVERHLAKNSDRIDETDAHAVLNRADPPPWPTELQSARSLGKLVACR